MPTVLRLAQAIELILDPFSFYYIRYRSWTKSFINLKKTSCLAPHLSQLA